MRPVHFRVVHLLMALLGVTLVLPAEAGLRSCTISSPTREAACKGKGFGATGRVMRAALIEPDLPWSPPLTEAEARVALERELSLKVGKHMRATDYPGEAQRWRWSGTALVEVVLTPEGYVHKVALSRSSGFRLLDERALEVVRRVPRVFLPVQLRGKRQRATIPIGFHFKEL
jgi:TonB family protein